MTGIVYLGTCAWCFRVFRSTRERCTQRHGWNEVSYNFTGPVLGGRRAGEYGHVQHSGDCGGMRHPPYELSTAGTEARLVHEKACVAQTVKTLAWLAEKPELILNREYSIYVNHRTCSVPYCVRLRPGDAFSIELGDWPREFSYESAWLECVRKIEAEKAYHEKDVAFCAKKIADWKLTELPEFAPRKAVVHYRTDPKRRTPWCGSKSYGISISDDADKVTCTRCVKSLESIRAERAAVDVEKADARRVFDWIKEHSGHGPATSKIIKAALGLDTRAFNRAVERASHWRSCLGADYVSSSNSTPATYSAFVNKDYKTLETNS
jgi:hypothetical protein